MPPGAPRFPRGQKTCETERRRQRVVNRRDPGHGFHLERMQTEQGRGQEGAGRIREQTAGDEESQGGGEYVGKDGAEMEPVRVEAEQGFVDEEPDREQRPVETSFWDSVRRSP